MRTVNVFLGIDMRMGHPGLIDLAKKNGVDLLNMEPQTACVFISRNKLRMKTFCYNGVLCYMRAMDIKRPFDLDSINEFPRAFDKNGQMNYAKALRATLEKKLKGRAPFRDMELLK